MAAIDAREQLQIARDHLERVQTAWYEPTDWSDLTIYGFYALESAVMAAAKHLGWSIAHSHPAKAEAAKRLHDEHGLPEVVSLLRDLNTARKAVAYGDVPRPRLNAEDVAVAVEEYVEEVAALLGEAE